MIRTLTLAALAGLVVPPAGICQDAPAVLARMRERQAERWETVDNYTVFLKMEGVGGLEGLDVFRHYQKYTVEGRPAFGLVSPDEYSFAQQQAEGTGMSSEELRLGADAMDMTGEAMASELSKEGWPMLPGMDPRETMGGRNSDFLRAAADAQDQAAAGDFGKGDATMSVRALDELASRLRMVGKEKVDDREAYHLRAEGLDRVLTARGDAQKFTLRSVDMWIDVEELVQLRQTMEGTAEADGQSREVTLEQLSQDYREVGPLYEPFRQVMRMSGMMEDMDPKQREELEKARRQMEEMQGQLDQMPAAARGMVERQMAKMREQMAMLDSGSFELVTEVTRIEINQGPPPPTPPSGG